MPIPFNPLTYTQIYHTLLAQHADPETAFWMEKYMKNNFKCFGIKKPLRDIINKEFLQAYGWPPQSDAEAVVRLMWEAPEREMQYFAMSILFHYRKKVEKDTVKLYEDLITARSWWDTIDFIAPNLVSQYFKVFPENIPNVTQAWMSSGNMWLQRSCILFQLKYKKETDTDLLFSFIEALTGSKEFFIQKAIGWALREYAKTNPQLVLDFADRTPLKPLSRREALRIINK